MWMHKAVKAKHNGKFFAKVKSRGKIHRSLPRRKKMLQHKLVREAVWLNFC